MEDSIRMERSNDDDLDLWDKVAAHIHELIDKSGDEFNLGDDDSKILDHALALRRSGAAAFAGYLAGQAFAGVMIDEDGKTVVTLGPFDLVFDHGELIRDKWTSVIVRYTGQLY